MMAKKKNDTSDSILGDINELLTRQPPRTRSRSEQSNIRVLDQKRQVNENNQALDGQQPARQQQLQKDFPATKALKTAHPNPNTHKIPASIVASIPSKAVAQSSPNIRLLTKGMQLPQEETWRNKLSLLALEKEEIRLLMQQVKKDVVLQLPHTIPPLVEKFLNQRLDAILERRPRTKK